MSSFYLFSNTLTAMIRNSLLGGQLSGRLRGRNGDTHIIATFKKPVISQKDKDHYNILTHIYGI